MRQIKYINVVDRDTTPLFTLWDKPQADTVPKIFAEVDGDIFVEDAFVLDSELCWIAAGLAMSNLGHEVPQEEIVQSANEDDTRYPTTVRLAMEGLTGHLSENEEMDELFVGEAEMWHTQIQGQSLNYILMTYGDRHPWIEQIVLAE